MANCVQCGRQLPALTFGKKLCQWCVQHEAAQRGEDSPIQRVEPAPWIAAAVQFDGGHASHFRNQRRGIRRHDFGWRFAHRANNGATGALGSELRTSYYRRPVVAVVELCIRAHRHHSHRVQYVVSMGSGQGSRVGLRSLDVWCGVSDHRRSGERNQPRLESWRHKRGSFWSNLRNCRSADRVILPGRILPAKSGGVGTAAKCAMLLQLCWLCLSATTSFLGR